MAEAAIRAAGILCVTPDGLALLCRRVAKTGDADQEPEPECWAFPGGHIEGTETPEEAARREFCEETGMTFDGELVEWTRRIKDGVDFTTFRGTSALFVPKLNDEHNAYAWVPPDAAQRLPLLPGARIALARGELNEQGIAAAIRDGELVSPQCYLNLLLVAIRITGTGAAYRRGLNEYTWRDPSLYLTPAFLERCQGLPVVLEHPKGDTLDTGEFHERTVGSVMLAYVQRDEVWGVARIYDEPTAQMIQARQLSTSPAVLFVGSAGPEGQSQGGPSVLIERVPDLLDHVAICAQGVWDKGGPPQGVQSVTARSDQDEKISAALALLERSKVASLLNRMRW